MISVFQVPLTELLHIMRMLINKTVGENGSRRWINYFETRPLSLNRKRVGICIYRHRTLFRLVPKSKEQPFLSSLKYGEAFLDNQSAIISL